ncbi:MAG: chorismate synthase [Bacteroidales bacterium]|nr:chorismate synthase [Bacteroidales bacterium]
MKNSLGTSVVLTLAGESHGPGIVAILDGMAPGVRVDESSIAARLAMRRPGGTAETARREPDAFSILSGVKDGFSTGAPIAILIPNTDVRSADYASFEGLARPSHADFAAHVKYAGFEDPRGGGHFSGRITAGIVAAGAVALEALRAKGILVGTHILSCAGVQDEPFAPDPRAQLELLDNRSFPVLADVEEEMTAGILAARAGGDSVGGVIQTAVAGLPAGVGEPWFGSVEGVIANAMLSVGGIKGIEFGSGFALAGMKGSEANDAWRMQDGVPRTLTNHNGGVNGGISNGMPVVFNCVVKPTPSISLPQQTIDLRSGQDATIEITGRHDPAIVRRICIVATSITALAVCDLLALHFGTDYLRQNDLRADR